MEQLIIFLLFAAALIGLVVMYLLNLSKQVIDKRVTIMDGEKEITFEDWVTMVDYLTQYIDEFEKTTELYQEEHNTSPTSTYFTQYYTYVEEYYWWSRRSVIVEHKKHFTAIWFDDDREQLCIARQTMNLMDGCKWVSLYNCT